jgi:hypothetical protein
MKAVNRAAIGRQAQYHSPQFKITLEPDGQLYLNNAYREYRTAPRAKRQEIIQRYASFLIAIPDPPPHSLEDVLPNLLPAVRDRISVISSS